MTAAEGGRWLEVELDESVARLAADTLDVFVGVTVEALEHASLDRDDLASRLSQADEMRRRLAARSGAVRLGGDERLVVDVVRAVASHAAYELEVLLESVAGRPERLDDEAIEQLRGRGAVASAAVDALVTCEAARRAS